MTAKEPQPEHGDVVQVTYKAVWDQDRGSHYWLRDLTDGTTTSVPNTATVEVLERADDPINDLAGVLRREEHDGGFVLYAKGAGAGTAWVVVSSSALQMLGRRFDDQFVAEFPRAGVVPGTPAAEVADAAKAAAVADVVAKVNACRVDESARPSVRVENTPGLSIPDRQKVADLLVSGSSAGAMRVLTETVGMAPADALAYVRAMPEYQTYLNHHGGGEKREPRTFPADGPEPPPEVTVLRDDHTDHDDMGYLVRAEDGWCWSPSPTLVPLDHGRIQSWKDAASSADGNLWEVV